MTAMIGAARIVAAVIDGGGTGEGQGSVAVRGIAGSVAAAGLSINGRLRLSSPARLLARNRSKTAVRVAAR